MHSVLLVVDKPNTSQLDPRWKGFVERADSHAATSEGSDRLAQNVWLLSLENRLKDFSFLVALADHHELTYRALFFEKEPEWSLSDKPAN